MRKFKTESKKLLDLMINSIYTNREIFLRELISNASDAIDKLYLKGLTDSEAHIDTDALAIDVAFDKDSRTIMVSDTGIGMSAAELEENLGTIAHSGSEAFKSENADKQGEDIDIIGQFGVGFYSSFMVAKRVKVVSRAFGSDVCTRWTSDGIEGYSISDVTPESRSWRPQAGTTITLTLKDDTEDANYSEFLSEWKLKDLIRKYSNYVRYPIRMLVTKSRQVKDENAAADAADDTADEAPAKWEEYTELETINSRIPIWKKKASEVSTEDYAEFYKSTFHDWTDPARSFTLHAEGTLEYDALLFIPGRAPFDLYSRDYEKGLQLYSSNVRIMEKCPDLLPDYYNFVHGVVDSADVSLNISRETLQQTRQLQAMERRIEKKITTELASMRDEDRQSYEKFFESFGRALKYGIYQSYGMKKDELADLLLFWSAREEKPVTLAEYAAAMPEGQDTVWFAWGDKRERLARMPVVKTALAKGYDVLLCTEDVDEFCFQAMQEYVWTPVEKPAETPAADAGTEPAESAGTAVDAAGPAESAASAEPRHLPIKNVTAEDPGFATEAERAAAEEASKANEGLLNAMKDALQDKVEKVAVSARLSGDDAPCVVTSQGDYTMEMETVLSQGPGAENLPKAQKVLELNAEHPVFAKLVAAEAAGDKEKISAYAELLFDQALLVEGIMPDDPVAFAGRICELM